MVGKLLIRFMAFTGDENDVTRAGEGDGFEDGFLAIDDDIVAALGEAGFDFGDDFAGVFLAWVI